MLSKTEQARLRTRYGAWALVTGASSGIGREIATQLAAAGFSVLLNARDQAALQSLSQALGAQYNANTQVVAADCGTPEGRAAILQAAENLPIGLFVASAGFGTSGLFVESHLQAEQNMLHVNIEGLLVLTHHFARRFAAQKRGGIVLLSSMVAFQGVPYAANYAATKAYVQSLAEGLAIELKPLGVDVLAAAPGPVTSGFGQRADMQMNGALRPEQVGTPILRALGRQTTVLPGWLTKVLVYSLRTVPRWGKVRIMSLVMGGMTAHQRSS